MASKINTIKRFEHLPKPLFVKAMAEINSQTARGAAIAGTAFLDLLLRKALERQIRSYDEFQDVLFTNRGVLQDFAARVQIAFAFKIIGSGAYTDLLILRDIRNAFAHSADAFDFDRTDIATKCNELWYPQRIQYAGRPMPQFPREKFIRAIELLADGLIESEKAKPGHIPLPQSFIQIGPPLAASSIAKKTEDTIFSGSSNSKPKNRQIVSTPASIISGVISISSVIAGLSQAGFISCVMVCKQDILTYPVNL